MVARPIISAEAATFLISMFFLFVGFYQVIASFWAHLPGWGRQALNESSQQSWVSPLGAMAASGLWVIGLFVGIDLILRGWTWISLALDLHKM